MPEQTMMRWEPILHREKLRGELNVTWKWKVVVGREKDCDVVLRHDSIPKKQGHFMRLRDLWWVEDYNSDKGIFIHGKRIHIEPVAGQPIDFAMLVRFRVETTPMPPEELRFREAIYATPEDDGGFLVYADWLQERGDEVGQLMVSPAPIAERWLGPLLSSGIAVTWRHGFLDTVKVRSSESIYAKKGVFVEVFSHPLAAFLRVLEVDAVLLAAENDHLTDEGWVTHLFEALRTEAPRTVRRLKIRLPNEHWLGFEGLFRQLKKNLPRLETGWDTLFTEGALV